MKKKYIKPTITVYEMEPIVILAGSGPEAPENALLIHSESDLFIDDEEI